MFISLPHFLILSCFLMNEKYPILALALYRLLIVMYTLKLTAASLKRQTAQQSSSTAVCQRWFQMLVLQCYTVIVTHYTTVSHLRAVTENTCPVPIRKYLISPYDQSEISCLHVMMKFQNKLTPSHRCLPWAVLSPQKRTEARILMFSTIRTCCPQPVPVPWSWRISRRLLME